MNVESRYPAFVQVFVRAEDVEPTYLCEGCGTTGNFGELTGTSRERCLICGRQAPFMALGCNFEVACETPECEHDGCDACDCVWGTVEYGECSYCGGPAMVRPIKNEAQRRSG